MSNAADTGLFELRRSVEAWLVEFGLTESLASSIEVSSAWASSSSPRSLVEDRCLAALDMVLWLFSIDDYDGPDPSAFVRRCRAQLEGAAPGQGAGARARHALVESLRARGRPLERYLASRVRYAEAIERRLHYGREVSVRPSFEEYLELRRSTIYVEQWIELWDVLMGWELMIHRQRQPSMRLAESAIRDWNIFYNELRSLSRDRSSGTPNLVDLWPTGIGNLEDRARAASEAYDRLRDVLWQDDRVPRGYIELLDRCRSGVDQAAVELIGRYDVLPTNG